MKLIYLASPFSDKERSVREARYYCALEATALMLKSGLFVYSPIVHNHHIAASFELPKDFEYWKSFDSLMIDRCNFLAVLMIPGWRESRGVTEEIEIAKELNKPTYFIRQDEVKYQPEKVKQLFEVNTLQAS